MRPGDDIAKRLKELSLAVLRLARALPRDVIGRHVTAQIVRCGSAGGSNYNEARRSESRADFAHKASIAAKEVGETLYWLQIIYELPLSRDERIPSLMREADELTAILIASVRTAKARAREEAAREP
jgi:four helix bundle protein